MIKLTIAGMSCEHCVRSVREALEPLNGVVAVTVDLTSGEADLEVEGNLADDLLVEAIEEEGYEVTGIRRG